VNKSGSYIPRTIHIEGMEIFDLSDIDRVFSQVSKTFKSSPKYISILDEKENPSNRTTEIIPGTLSGTMKAPFMGKKKYQDYKYFSWDLQKSEIQDFVKYANSEISLEQCEYFLTKPGFPMDNVEENEIAKISGKVEWISATAYIQGPLDHLKLYIRIKYIPPTSEDELRRSKEILEKAVEIYFLKLNGFSHERSPCEVPSIPKVVSLTVLCNNNFMGLLTEEFDKALLGKGFALTNEIHKVLSLLGYDGTGFPSVIRESENLYHVIWQGGFSLDGRTFYFVDFTDLEKFILEWKRHSLPQKAPAIRGTNDLISDILSHVSFWFSFLKFYESRDLDNSEKQYMALQGDFIRKFHSILTRKYDKILLRLVEIRASLQKSHAEIEKIFEGLPGLSSFLLEFYSPEVAISQLNIFDAANLTEDERMNIPLTLSKSLDILRKRANTDMNTKLSKLTESVEKTIALINSRIQIKETRMNTYLVALTFVLVLVAIISLFGLKW
jgi:hypothetical protein